MTSRYITESAGEQAFEKELEPDGTPTSLTSAQLPELLRKLQNSIALMSKREDELDANIKTLSSDIDILSKMIPHLAEIVNRLIEITSLQNNKYEPAEIQKKIRFLKELKETHIQRFYVLQLKEAQNGRNTPPEVVMEIDELKDKINAVEVELKTLMFDQAKFGSTKDSSE